ncbi:MAG TPA: FKBP-type peptidyl-prolyl cis-trans isomerase, partial [Cystobacter sp.]
GRLLVVNYSGWLPDGTLFDTSLGRAPFSFTLGQGRAFLGALGGAAVGTLLGVALHGVMEEVVGNRDALGFFRKSIALGFIGAGSTVGYQWAAGGSRVRRR